MNRKIGLSLAMLVLCSAGASARGVEELIASLKSVGCYDADVTYRVMMSLQDDVDYRLRLHSEAAPADTLAPCSYLTEWELDAPSGPVKGFFAYFDGNVYNYRGGRLAEYHVDWDSIPFRPRGTTARIPGIQRQAQFAPVLPQFIAEQIAEIVSEPEGHKFHFASDTVVGGRKADIFAGKLYVNGDVAREYTYIFDPVTSMPLKLVFENNPGALAEQTIEVIYDNVALPEDCPPLSEERLMESWSEAFEKHRESNYAIENLPGQRLPTFSLPTTAGGRYSHQSSEPFRSATVIVLLDAAQAFTPDMIKAIRDANNLSSVSFDIIWAFTGNNTDQIEEIISGTEPGEQLLMSARSLARDCGASSLPATIIVRPDGTVADVMLGYNKDAPSVVIQKVALAAR